MTLKFTGGSKAPDVELVNLESMDKEVDLFPNIATSPEDLLKQILLPDRMLSNGIPWCSLALYGLLALSFGGAILAQVFGPGMITATFQVATVFYWVLMLGIVIDAIMVVLYAVVVLVVDGQVIIETLAAMPTYIFKLREQAKERRQRTS